MSGTLVGRRALVVGGTTGIGRGIADAWAAAGAEVTVCGRSEPAGDGAAGLHWEPLDLTRTGEAGARLERIAGDRVDLACFAAVSYGARRAVFEDVAVDEWRTQLDINVHGLWLTLRAALPGLRAARPGLFVGVSSEVVYNAGPGRSGYTASKAAAKALLESVAQEEDESRVRIVQVLPAGMVDTPSIRRRRPAGFDYSDYMVPADFARNALELAATAGAGHHGDSLVVDRGGDWWSVRERMPVSQSRPVRT
ncbi:oxidoreductase [Actinoplanes sp. SE50]|uniref:SDR family oxidoreductase n=1 Tax=unclassified Actinoplanes TaxID=2626549 RepID=UPI00000B0769|nr:MULTISPECIES: SDR family oxidoreductase [unclassified Actinoplanes]AEV84573.1 cyclitol oxidoreductase [Actinoplanes sp. SE50/110]ATO82965.1 oxidoreductase [Actinoplanes sp. SE50]CAD29484.1 cyclitol oxidoreductase AcbN [Actinoplanes sp. SE50/110]SLM00373.1 cyclitol oxidoreductase [Actinoplanes sp. SE50/110]